MKQKIKPMFVTMGLILPKSRKCLIISEMFDQEMLVELDDRFDYGEERWIGTGFLKRGVAVVVWTERWGDVIRIISVRRATLYERECFERYLSGGF